MNEADENSDYAELLRERQEALSRFSLAHQRLMYANMLLREAEEELAEKDSRLAKEIGLSTGGVQLP